MSKEEDDVVCAEDYEDEHAQQFVRDADSEYLEVEHYHGRYGWEGPAVRVDSLNEFSTEVPTQFDNMGMGFIVYPAKPAKRVVANG